MGYHLVERLASDGTLFRLLERTLPRIPDEFLDCVVYLYPSESDAKNGTRVGGTGFLVAVPEENIPGGCAYVVTNDHVAVNAGAIRFNTKHGSTAVLPVVPDQWSPHPAGDDVAVLLLGVVPAHFRYKALPMDRFSLTEKEIVDKDVGPGDDVFFMGRFISHDGQQRNVPVVRFGSIAMMPGEPIWQKDRSFWQESFLIEARSISGFSGSPVMLYIPPFTFRFPGGTIDSRTPLKAEGTMALIGIDWGQMTLKDEAATYATGMAAVVPVWKLHELIADKDVVLQRREFVKRVQEIPDSGAVLDSAEGSEFQRLENLTRKLLVVSKKELDDKREAT
jgi:hypothetical protein